MGGPSLCLLSLLLRGGKYIASVLDFSSGSLLCLVPKCTCRPNFSKLSLMSFAPFLMSLRDKKMKPASSAYSELLCLSLVPVLDALGGLLVRN